jgi:DNA-binding transcriptional ArsR family regulator
MKEGPDIARIAALIGDPARANILTALMAGRALTAGELASEAGVTPQTASSHLAKLIEGRLVQVQAQGRHRYHSLASPSVASALEALMGLAAGTGALRTRPGPRDLALRQARVCYSHLAGEAGTLLHDSLTARGFLAATPDGLTLTDTGAQFVAGLGIALPPGRPPLCRTCLDWSERRSHLGGRLGRVLLDHMLTAGWLRRVADSRALVFTPVGRTHFAAAFPGP